MRPYWRCGPNTETPRKPIDKARGWLGCLERISNNASDKYEGFIEKMKLIAGLVFTE